MLDIEKIIDDLYQLEKILNDLDKLKFRAYTYMPLTFDESAVQELLVKNKRISFRYEQLKIKKTRLINKLLGYSAKADSTNNYITYKLTRLKQLDDDSLKLNINNNNRNRKINNLKTILSNLINEHIAESLITVNQINAYLFDLDSNNFRQIDPIDLYSSKDFKITVMELNYLSIYFSNDEIKTYMKYLIFKYSGHFASDIQFFDARTILPESTNSGFSAFAYAFKIDGNLQCYISFKGTEGSMEDPRIKSFTKRFDNYVNESFLDWAYNIDSMLLGNNENNKQLDLARNFTHIIIGHMNELDSNNTIYALGHSLGGHFVQTIQLLDTAFDFGYTLNSAPIQLKQVRYYKPNLFDEDTWNKLYSLTNYNAQDIETDLFIRNLMPKSFNEITNEWFRNDITRVYFGFPNTFYIGTSNYLNTTNWYYPFKSNITGYLKEEDIQIYTDFFGGLIAYLKHVKSKNGTRIMGRILLYTFQTLRMLYESIKTEKAKNVFKDFATYLYDSKIFKDTPTVVQDNFKRDLSKPMTTLRVFQGEWPFLSSLNTDMMDTVIYFHTIEGAKFFK
ncbi:hypothetical protein RD055328_06300 [Companilactobacillus sp. RD055328]|uniref:DUF6792 domain-containing protein n=1 Tax=Companilactobacillus sp. RD055328 TaxID=2916634 RepID=UPI001FC84933|nr:DUF6792 domain-containing protein [Companilactobacillus sp. RD055328]GKQ42707.1 hypothetical protein RD055328_06300 [Companilactobacillus sp. RD055328]